MAEPDDKKSAAEPENAKKDDPKDSKPADKKAEGGKTSPPEAKSDSKTAAEKEAPSAKKPEPEKPKEEKKADAPAEVNINVGANTAASLTDRDWKLLLRRIRAGKCTPFLGAGASYGALPLGSEIATKWSEQFNYPLEDKQDLARVSQYLAIEFDPMFPKDELLDSWFRGIKPPEFNKDEPHAALAELPLPIYLTTNYDNFMTEALKAGGRKPRHGLCRWNKLLKEEHDDIFEDYEPDVENPAVFHFHGHKEVPESLVLTEDDYLDFLVNVSNDRTVLPLRIQRALAGTSLLFIGYRLADLSFRVLFRGLVTATESSLRRISVTVQLPPAEKGNTRSEMQQKYLTKYFGSKDIRVYWGSARQFASELRQRWEDFSKDE